MTEQEATNVLKELLSVPQEMIVKYDSVANEEQKDRLSKIYTAQRMAIKALEKQIPIKPIKAFDEDVNQHWCSCPICLNGLCWEHNHKPIEHCMVCGQALDWSVKE